MMFQNKLIKGVLSGILILSIVVGVMVISRRVQFEKQNTTIEVAISLKQVHRLSLLGGLDVSVLLQKIKEETDITTIAVEEDTIEDFVDSGRITLLKGSEIINMYRIGHINRYILHNLYKKIKVKPNRFYVVVDRKDDYTRIRDYLSAELGKDRVKRIGRLDVLEVINEEEDLLELGVGISKDVVNELIGYGFNIIPRLKNSQRVNWNIVRLKMSSLEGLKNLKTVVFEGKTVLGYPNELEFTQDKLQEFGLNIGHIEFANQLGFKSLAFNMLDSVIRVHSISESEMKVLNERQAIARYVRAAKERGNKILFLYPIQSFSQGLTNTDFDITFFNKVLEELRGAGFELGQIKNVPLSDPLSVKPWEIFLLSLGVFIFMMYFLNFYFPINVIYMSIGGLIFSMLFYSIELLGYTALWVRAMALLSAVIFPSLAIISQFPTTLRSHKETKRFLEVGMYFLKIFGISLLGAFYIVALLTDMSYLLSIKLFFGVKISLLLPLLLIGIFFFLHPHRMSSFYYVFKRLFFSPVRTLQLVSVIFCLAFVFIYILRSGNYISLHIPVLENLLRESSENIFSIRPRTKEFLIGYPLLFLTFLYVDRGLTRNWVWFFNGLGSVALISLINSFCHLHTPLLISCYRSLLGILLGTIIGLIYCGLFEVLKFSFQKKRRY